MKILAIAAAIILLASGIYFLTGVESETIDSRDTQATQQNEEEASITEDFTESEVATHNSANDCWTIIDGKVYDITEYVPRHPGGADILLACGQDGSTLFNERQTSDGTVIGSGTEHSGSAASQLESFLLGDLIVQ